MSIYFNGANVDISIVYSFFFFFFFFFFHMKNFNVRFLRDMPSWFFVALTPFQNLAGEYSHVSLSLSLSLSPSLSLSLSFFLSLSLFPSLSLSLSLSLCRSLARSSFSKCSQHTPVTTIKPCSCIFEWHLVVWRGSLTNQKKYLGQQGLPPPSSLLR